MFSGVFVCLEARTLWGSSVVIYTMVSLSEVGTGWTIRCVLCFVVCWWGAHVVLGCVFGHARLCLFGYGVRNRGWTSGFEHLIISEICCVAILTLPCVLPTQVFEPKGAYTPFVIPTYSASEGGNMDLTYQVRVSAITTSWHFCLGWVYLHGYLGSKMTIIDLPVVKT